MNAMLKPEAVLPLPFPPSHPDSRRRQLGTLTLEDREIEAFNRLLAQLEANAPSISADQVVTLARWLQSLPRERAVAVVSERLSRAEKLRRMLQDGDWDVSGDFRERARLLIDYLQRVDDLIPDEKPLFGHLDDALLVELSWSAFAGETQDYNDFQRFQRVERPRGTAAERRLAWESACVAEAALMQQRRQVRESRYASFDAPTALFRVG